VLEFLLILGQVPGTKFYFTFAEILLALTAVFLALEIKLHSQQLNYRLTEIELRLRHLNKSIKQSRIGVFYAGISVGIRPNSRH